jgi:hypothetical protein
VVARAMLRGGTEKLSRPNFGLSLMQVIGTVGKISMVGRVLSIASRRYNDMSQ